jgi:lipid-A-disaccharide synthase-like uncharacterized protein
VNAVDPPRDGGSQTQPSRRRAVSGRLITSTGARGTAAGLCVLVVYLHHYYYLLLNPTINDRALITRYQEIAAGTDRAPDQYRLLIPSTAAVITRMTTLPLHVVVVLIDSVSLLGGAVLLAWLLCRRGLESQILPALLYVGAVAVTALLFPRPETLPGFLGATCVLTAYLHPGRGEAVLGVAGAVLLAGCRPEMAAAAALAFVLQGWRERRSLKSVGGAVLAGLGALGTLIPICLHPRTSYMTNLVQVEHNLDPRNQLVLAATLAPVLVYLTRNRAARWAPLLTWVGAAVGLTFVVGRVDEVRILFPLAGVLAYVAADLWADASEDQSAPHPARAQV